MAEAFGDGASKQIWCYSSHFKHPHDSMERDPQWDYCKPRLQAPPMVCSRTAIITDLGEQFSGDMLLGGAMKNFNLTEGVPVVASEYPDFNPRNGRILRLKIFEVQLVILPFLKVF